MSSARDRDELHASYDEDTLNSFTVPELRVICKNLGINDKGLIKRRIIALILGNPGDSAEASARASSAMEDSARADPTVDDTTSVKFVKPLSGRRSPERRREGAKGGDDPETQLKAERERLKAQWEAKIKTEGQQPWANPATLKLIFDTEMMPSPPSASSSPTVVLLVGPAASGKSSALEMVGLDLTDQNTVRVDPDKIYEWLANKYGYFPPELKELKDIKDPKKYDDESPAQYRERCVANRAKLTKQNTDRLVWWLANKGTFEERYGREFEDDQLREFEAAKFCTPKTHAVLGQYRVALPLMEEMIFEGATQKGLNVLLDTTGSMKEPFLERMAAQFTTAGYKVVIVLVVSAKEDCKARVSGTDGRNEKQHRKLDEGVVGQIWEGFVKNGKDGEESTPCRWERFSRAHGTEFAVVQNTWTPRNHSGSARVIYRRDSGGITEQLQSLQPGELSHILRTYNMEIDSETGVFLCRGSASASNGERGGSSRKRRISRRRIHGSRARKTIKKYSRHVTRRHRHCRH